MYHQIRIFGVKTQNNDQQGHQIRPLWRVWEFLVYVCTCYFIFYFLFYFIFYFLFLPYRIEYLPESSFLPPASVYFIVGAHRYIIAAVEYEIQRVVRTCVLYDAKNFVALVHWVVYGHLDVVYRIASFL